MSVVRSVSTLFIAAIILMAVGCSSGDGNRVAKVDYSGAMLSSESDSLAYIIGMSIGEQLQQMDSSINVDVVCRAIVEYSQGRAAMSMESGRTAYMHYKLYLDPERRRGYESRFLADLLAADRSFTRTKSGLIYNIEVIGNERNMPKFANDWVTIKYTIFRSDATQLYPAVAVKQTEMVDTLVVDTLAVDTLAIDSVEVEEIVDEVVEEVVVTTAEESFVLSDLPKGVGEALRLIGVGGRVNLWIPSRLGYGEEGSERFGVGPIETLYYQIELIAREENTGVERRQEQFEADF